MAEFSKLLGGDPAQYSPAQAGAAFSSEVKRLVREEGLSLEDAWQKAKLLHPGTHQRLCAGASGPAALANAGVPHGWKLFLPSMHLPQTTTAGEFAAAWRANGEKSVPVNVAAINDALIKFTADDQGITKQEAAKAVAQKFALLKTFVDASENYRAAYKQAVEANGGDAIKAHAAAKGKLGISVSQIN
jgi:hypothetical protein